MSADEYIYFEDCAVPSVRKTRIVRVCNRKSGFHLGHIRWYGAWRQYCFSPSILAEVTFNEDCLKRIAEECKTMTKEHEIGRSRN